MEKKISRFNNEVVRILNGMALGLFSSLIIGLIIKQIGTFLNIETLVNVGMVAQYMTGPAIGASVAYSIGAPALTIFSSVAAGAIGAGSINFVTGTVALGEPLGATIAALAGAYCGKYMSGKTKIDIILVPLVTIIIGSLVGLFVSPVVASLMRALGAFINRLTLMYPFPMGVLVSTVVGMVLTLPISSAAICISLGLDGLAAGAACVGCCCQMVGFAVASYKENKVGGLISQGLGTSMLQISNIWKNWKIWIPPTLASAILGPVSTCIFKMTNNPAGAGMGTSGLVGQLNAISTMGAKSIPIIILMHFILPALITLAISSYMRKKGWIKDGDMLLSV